jgi:hypothetical protein
MIGASSAGKILVARFAAPGTAATAALSPIAVAAVAATTAAISSAAAATATERTPAATLSLRAGFVDIQRTPSELGAVESGNCTLRLGGVWHFYKCKAAGAAGIAVGFDADSLNAAVCLKQGTNTLFGCTEIKVPHKYIFHAVSFRDLKAS